MEEELPDQTNVIGTCHTEGCGNSEIGIFIAELYGSLYCGVCSNEITDIVPAE